jgi:hypothetical protein
MRSATLKVAVVLVLVLAGCATGEGGTGPEDHAGPTVAEEETTSYDPQEETTALEGESNLEKPPQSTLSYGGREVKGTLGSYCWESGGTGACADAMFLVPTRKRTLAVSSDSEMVFRYGGESPPKTVEITAFPFNKKGEVTLGSHRELRAHGSGVERAIPVELAQGTYVVDVFTKVPQGDATYYFRIVVE